MGRRGLIRVATGALLTSVVACTVHKQETPSLTGPSEFAKSITLSVNPDVLSQDGQSQSVVSVDARDSNGQPLRNVPLRADVAVNGTVTTSLGQLSARSLVTDSNGHASVVYTAPTLPPGLPIAAGMIQILVTPQEGDFGNSTPRAVTLNLVVPPGVGGPVPSGSLVAKFTANPSTPTEDQVVLFDASTSTTTGAPIIRYAWDFGDRRPGATWRHRHALVRRSRHVRRDADHHRCRGRQRLHFAIGDCGTGCRRRRRHSRRHQLHPRCFNRCSSMPLLLGPRRVEGL